MPKYLLLKHYRGGPEPHRSVPPIDQWDPKDVEAHMAFQNHVSEIDDTACAGRRSSPGTTTSSP